MPLNLALLMGGTSGEREVSLASGRQVAAHLDPRRYRVTVYDPAADLARLLEDRPKLDLAFLALHGPGGEDGCIQGFLELLGLPYVGSGVLTSALCMDKKLTKLFYRQAGLKVAADRLLRRGEDNPEEAAAEIAAGLGLPVVVKPSRLGSSVGLTLVQEAGQLAPALAEAFAWDELILVEQYLRGAEVTAGVLGNGAPTALPLIKIVPSPGHAFFDYQAKYEPGEAQEICPAPLEPELTETIQNQALVAHKVLGCRGLSRTDFIVVGTDCYALETNTLPGLTANSLLPKAAAQAGLSFGVLLDKIIACALEP